MEALLIGLAAGSNFMVIYWKFKAGRYEDAILDAGILLLLSWMFGGTQGGMVVATIASVFVSVVLYFDPPKLTSEDEEPEEPKTLSDLVKKTKVY